MAVDVHVQSLCENCLLCLNYI